jgi:hypothetical protein
MNITQLPNGDYHIQLARYNGRSWTMLAEFDIQKDEFKAFRDHVIENLNKVKVN